MKGVAGAVDRALKKNEGNAEVSSYDEDALLVAKVLTRHFGDEALAFFDRVWKFIPGAQEKQ